MATSTVTFSEVQKHDKESDAWLVISNKVYDVTNFLEEHPGGGEILLEEAGKDATESFENVGHSEEARELLENLLVGVLAESGQSTEARNNILPPPTELPDVASEPVCQLDPQKWKSLGLRYKTAVSPNVFRFTFNLPDPNNPLGLPTGQHIVVRASIGGEQVSRSYTPVSDNNDIGHLDVLCKIYPNGTMTKYLESLEPGDHIEFRGPKGNMQYSKEYATRISMIAGGTGITPMYQLIHAICSNPTDNTSVRLVYGNNSESDILLREDLNSFATQFPDKFQVHYVLVHPPPAWTGGVGYITGDLIQSKLIGNTDNERILLCGPPPMISAIGTALASMGYQRPRVPSRMADPVFSF